MYQRIAKQADIPPISIQQMLEVIRANHVDIIPIIKEELAEIIPMYIEEIIENMYNKIGEE